MSLGRASYVSYLSDATKQASEDELYIFTSFSSRILVIL